MEMSLAVWRQVARIGFAASEDPEDVLLVGLRLQLSGRWLTATATNRYVVAKTKVKVDDDGADPRKWDGVVVARQALLVEKDVRSLERYRNKKDHPDSAILLRATVADEWVEVTLADDGSLFDPESITRRMDLISGTYPEVVDLINAAGRATRDQRSTAVAANPDYLTTAAKTIDWSTPGLPVSYVMPEANSREPIVCKCQADSEWVALVMPVHGGGPE